MFSGRRLELMPWGLNRFHASGQTAPNGGPNFMYTFNANNQIISGGSVVYDAAGNMIEDEIGNTYTYDDENRMVAIAGSNPVAYTFDAFNRRVELTNTGGYKDLFYDVAGRMSYQAGNEAGFSRVFFGSQQVATINSTGTYYYYGDQVGTLRANTGSSGTVVNTCASLAFGDFQTACTNPGTTNDKADFTGQWNDPYNMAAFPARSYSLGQGRWASTDPAGLAAVDPSNQQTWNRYAYVGNNPLSFTDPLGLFMINPCYNDPSCGGGGFGGGGGGFDPCFFSGLFCGGGPGQPPIVPPNRPGGGGGSKPPNPPVLSRRPPPPTMVTQTSDCPSPTGTGREINYDLVDANGNPVPSYTVVEHQTDTSRASSAFGPGTSFQTPPPGAYSGFDDSLIPCPFQKPGNSIQTFTVTTSQPSPTAPQQPVMIQAMNGQVYGSLGIYFQFPQVFVNGVPTP